MKNTFQEPADSEQQELLLNPSYPTPSGPTGRLVPSIWQALLARRGIVAYLPIVGAVILLFCGAFSQMFAASTDGALYQCYAVAFWQGSQSTNTLQGTRCLFSDRSGAPQNSTEPFQILPLEYPPLTLSIFSLALIAPAHYYLVAFAFWMALAAFALYWLLQRYGPRGAGLACAFYLVVGAWATAEGRFDLIPAGLTLLCLIAAERRRWTLAYVALALGSLLKIYPLLLLPALFIAEQTAYGRFHKPLASARFQTLPGDLWQTVRGAYKWSWKNMLLFWGLILLVSCIFALINFQGAVVSQFSYFTSRPVQVESLGSSVLWLAALFGHSATIAHNFGSVNIRSNLDHRVALLTEGLFVLGYVLAILWQWRGKLDLVQAFIALILIFVVTSKVFSPQYLIWLIPLLAYNGSFNRIWLALWGSMSLLSTTIYPYMYALTRGLRVSAYIPEFIGLVTVRNALLLLITLAFLFNWWNINQRQAPALSRDQANQID